MGTVFTLAALIGGTVLVFQFVLMLFGIGDDGDVAGADGGDFSGHADFGHDMSGHVGGDVSHGDVASGDVTQDHHTPWHHAADADLGHPGAHWFYEVLSLRTLSAALTFFGLAGKTAVAYGYSMTGSTVLASVVGLGAMYAVYWLFKQLYKLQHSGTENIRNAVGAQAVVYIPIPGKRVGAGKVTFRLQNRLVEYQAVTDEESRLATGEKVVVVAIVNADTVRVARVEAPVAEMAGTKNTA
jgi:hypothetical protein